MRNNFKNMKTITYINDPLETLLKEDFECVDGFSNRHKIKLYIIDLLDKDKYLQFPQPRLQSGFLPGNDADQFQENTCP